MNKKYLLDLAERIVLTFFEAFFGALLANASGVINMPVIAAAAIAGLAAVVTLVKGLVAKPINDPNTAGFVDPVKR